MSTVIKKIKVKSKVLKAGLSIDYQRNVFLFSMAVYMRLTPGTINATGVKAIQVFSLASPYVHLSRFLSVMGIILLKNMNVPGEWGRKWPYLGGSPDSAICFLICFNSALIDHPQTRSWIMQLVWHLDFYHHLILNLPHYLAKFAAEFALTGLSVWKPILTLTPYISLTCHSQLCFITFCPFTYNHLPPIPPLIQRHSHKH